MRAVCTAGVETLERFLGRVRIFISRFLSLFTFRKIWGPAITILGLAIQAPRWGWHVLDIFGRLDVLWRIVETMGGSPALIMSVLSSWQFGLALIVIGVAYTVFIGEPAVGVQRHPALPYFAASFFFACLALLAGMAIYGEYELRLREAFAKGAAGIPRANSPANPLTPSNQRPLVLDAARSLTVDQQRILITTGGAMRDDLGKFLVAFLSTDTETQQYANAFHTAFSRAAIKSTVASQPVMGAPGDEGLLIQVADKNAPPPEAKKLEQLLLLADISVRFGDARTFDTKMYPVVLFVGPLPINR